jgi:hypothetical protein
VDFARKLIDDGQHHPQRPDPRHPTLGKDGGADGMSTPDQSLMARLQTGSIEPIEANLKVANKVPFAALLS